MISQGNGRLYLDSAARTVSVDFRHDGTFAQRIIANQGGIQECLGGTWSLEGALVHLTGYVTVGDGTSQSCTWRMIGTGSGLALSGGDGPDAQSFVWSRRGQPTPARCSDSLCQSTFRILCCGPSTQRPILRAIWRGSRLGAAMGAAAGVAAGIVLLWMWREYPPPPGSPGASAPLLATSLVMLVLGGMAAFVGTVVGAMGFGAIAVARRFRTSRLVNTEESSPTDQRLEVG